MSYFADMNAVWDAWVPEGHAPARACVAAKMAREALLGGNFCGCSRNIAL